MSLGKSKLGSMTLGQLAESYGEISIQTLSAINITQNEARIRAEILDDGGATNKVQVQFRWRIKP